MACCLSTARSFFTVLDQTKPPAPVWRCSFAIEASVASALSRAASKHGGNAVIRSPPFRSGRAYGATTLAGPRWFPPAQRNRTQDCPLPRQARRRNLDQALPLVLNFSSTGTCKIHGRLERVFIRRAASSAAPGAQGESVSPLAFL